LLLRWRTRADQALLVGNKPVLRQGRILLLSALRVLLVAEAELVRAGRSRRADRLARVVVHRPHVDALVERGADEEVAEGGEAGD